MEKSVVKHELSFAQFDPAHCLTPGLFRSLRPSERAETELDVNNRSTNSKRFVRFVGKELLDGTDMRVLQGLVAMAGLSGMVLSSVPKTEVGRTLRGLLEIANEPNEKKAVVVEMSLNKLRKELGYASDSKATTDQLKKCIQRMADVVIFLGEGATKFSFRMLSYIFSGERGNFQVALNPLLAETILGRKRKFAFISMVETRQLRSERARLLHHRLSGWVGGRTTKGRVSIDVLSSYIWPDDTTEVDAKRKRRERVRAALEELKELKEVKEVKEVGWCIVEDANQKDMFIIKRPPQEAA